MLSFAPDDAGSRVPVLERKAVEAEGAGKPAVQAERARPTVTATATANPRRAGVPDAWHEIVDKLALGGVARMLAEHSVARRIDADHVDLILDPAHDTLLGDAQIRAIERALAGHFGHAVTVSIEPGAIEIETPADRRARMTKERQQAAENLLESDETVRTLLSEFDGRLEEVHPLEPAAGSGRSGGSRREGGGR